MFIACRCDPVLKDKNRMSASEYARGIRALSGDVALFTAAEGLCDLSKSYQCGAYAMEFTVIQDIYARAPDLLIGYLRRLITDPSLYDKCPYNDAYFRFFSSILLMLSRQDPERYKAANHLIGNCLANAKERNSEEHHKLALLYLIDASDVDEETKELVDRLYKELLRDEDSIDNRNALNAELRRFKEKSLLRSDIHRLPPNPHFVYIAYKMRTQDLSVSTVFVNYDGSPHAIHQHVDDERKLRELLKRCPKSSDSKVLGLMGELLERHARSSCLAGSGGGGGGTHALLANAAFGPPSLPVAASVAAVVVAASPAVVVAGAGANTRDDNAPLGMTL